MIPVPFKKLKAICHTADIHIRLFRRHEEYQQCFDRLYADIKEQEMMGLTDYVIVIAGDIVHAKNDMSPEMVDITSRFLSSLADIAPTIVIAGNHDTNLSNQNRLDSLSPIISALNHPNLHYLRNSGVTTVADTDIAVMSLFDEQANWPTADDCSSPNKIALYHGPVYGATTDTNFVITNRHVNVSMFDGFDMVLLGDIHAPQILQVYDKKAKKPAIAYCGSLIQQNHGEAIEGHGWCLWDVSAREFEFMELHNEYGYCTLEVINGKIKYPTNMPDNVRMRLFTGELDNTKVKKIITSLRNKYNIIELSVNKSRFSATQRAQATNHSHNNLDLTDISTQNLLLQDWITRNKSAVDSDVVEMVFKINDGLNGKIKHEDHSRNIHWRPLVFKFSNMFSYGEDNEVNFGDMNGLYGLFAANASGKSSVTDSLMFCLYDKTPRAFKGDHIINNRKDKFNCELTFEIDSHVYGIRRDGVRKKNGDVKVDVQFWRVEDNGDRTSLNGEDRRDTNANIRAYVGNYEDFVMTALSSQTSNALFIDKSHSERKDLLIQFMGLNVFDKLYDSASDEFKEIHGVLKKFKRSEVTDEISDVSKQLGIEETDLGQLEVAHLEAKTDRDVLEKSMGALQEKKIPSVNVYLHKDRIVEGLKNIDIEEEAFIVRIANLEQQLLDVETSIEKNISAISTYDLPQAQENLIQHTSLTKEIQKLYQSRDKFQISLEEKLKSKDTLSKYEYNTQCAVCTKNSQSVIENLDKLSEEVSTLLSKIEIINEKKSLLESEISSVKDAPEVSKTITQLLGAIDSDTKKKDALIIKKHETERLQQESDTAKRQLQLELDEYQKNEKNIVHNQQLSDKIDVIRSSIDKKKTEIDRLEKEIRTAHGRQTVLLTKKDLLWERLREVEELELTFEAYSVYMEAVGRDGIPYEMIAKTIPEIESSVNNILSQIVDFSVSLEVDGKNINGKISYNFDRIWPLENSSGMERFVSSIAIRIALMNASNLPKSNFFVADEGFGSLDAEHIHVMQVLFNILKTQFDFVFVISHLDNMRDMVDNIIEIKKEDGYSYINV